MFGGHGADKYPTCVRYLSRDICPPFLLRFSAMDYWSNNYLPTSCLINSLTPENRDVTHLKTNNYLHMYIIQFTICKKNCMFAWQSVELEIELVSGGASGPSIRSNSLATRTHKHITLSQVSEIDYDYSRIIFDWSICDGTPCNIFCTYVPFF